jgi:hypothetical protein
MNLNLTVDGEEVWLDQTPTYITEMCLMKSDGYATVMTGKKAIRALRIYNHWRKYEHQKYFNSVGGKDDDGFLRDTSDRINEFDKFIDTLQDKDIEVYMM